MFEINKYVAPLHIEKSTFSLNYLGFSVEMYQFVLGMLQVKSRYVDKVYQYMS